MSLSDKISSELRRASEMKEVLTALVSNEGVADVRQAIKNRADLEKRAKFLVDDLAWEASEHECCESAVYADLRHKGDWCRCCSGRCVVFQLADRENLKALG